ncbi:hypothetical protein GQ53DRAFT_224996 [Thozetella sp. PMI_491]|nr:hypothetical protein GQ53DRAFT_224996 [Thozetella sp. PMI_491]
MTRLEALYPLIALLLLPLSAIAAKPKNAILLSQVQSLTLRGDKSTSHRRVPAIPQLKCISPKSICALHHIDSMRCVNQGSGYSSEDIQWACTASLPSTLKLGSTEVICEGYSSPDDPYVLKGSCGVEYRLVLTEEGERRHPNLGGSDQDVDWSAYLFGIVFVAIAAWIIYSACVQAGNQRQAGPQRRRPGWGGNWGGGWGPGGGGGGGFGGGGGGGRFDDPPPPYPGSKPSTQQGWQPGFWSGVAGGAAAGYMAGRSGRQDNGYQRGGWGGNGYGSTWGSGGGSSWGSGRASSSSSSGSNSRHESTGFGSTSRR